ncbi:class I SAM-dependent methyltransferase [Thiocapsa roseopersicina]|uniref:Methyltransferase domain-containing protein n=1 Tax=Thiocapsa roseopersicina TaxID=1058 RepID=A0A1H2Y4I7_THIRO|nr:class I SAM-dependent methyltransferase [Thiocapsa roseopersicina]SDW99990.1 hypothetical protein SAMN05421783_11237 [Thiocapsa roseopersicina]
MQTAVERVFSTLVNWTQGNIFPLAIRKSRVDRRYSVVEAQPEEWRQKLRDLGIPLEETFWGPMTLLPRRVSCIIDAIEATPPKAVLEIGSGSSTILLAALAAKHGFSIVSLENFKGSYERVKSLLAAIPRGSDVRLESVGFVRRRYPDQKRYWWYDVDLGRYDTDFDFVLIDGPSSTLVGRNGGLPEIAPYLSPNNRIYVDDATGTHGLACLSEWKRYFPNLQVTNPASCPKMALMHLPRE